MSIIYILSTVSCKDVSSDIRVQLSRRFGQECKIYQIPPQLQLQQPLCLEVWIDAGHTFDTVDNYEPFKKQIIHPEVSWVLRTIIEDSEDFTVEFNRQVYKDLPWAWIGKVTANGENINNKARFNPLYRI